MHCWLISNILQSLLLKCSLRQPLDDDLPEGAAFGPGFESCACPFPPVLFASNTTVFSPPCRHYSQPDAVPSIC